MSDFLLAVAERDATFDFDELVGGVLDAWPGTRFVASHGRLATTTYGQLEFLPQSESFGLLVELLASRGGISLDGPLLDVAELIAC
jgi:hypothetical protein